MQLFEIICSPGPLLRIWTSTTSTCRRGTKRGTGAPWRRICPCWQGSLILRWRRGRLILCLVLLSWILTRKCNICPRWLWSNLVGLHVLHHLLWDFCQNFLGKGCLRNLSISSKLSPKKISEWNKLLKI